MTDKANNVGPMCACGHGLYEHYMCGGDKSSRCLNACGCKRFDPNGQRAAKISPVPDSPTSAVEAPSKCLKCELTRHFGTSDEAFIARYHASDHDRALIEDYRAGDSAREMQDYSMEQHRSAPSAVGETRPETDEETPYCVDLREAIRRVDQCRRLNAYGTDWPGVEAQCSSVPVKELGLVLDAASRLSAVSTERDALQEKVEELSGLASGMEALADIAIRLEAISRRAGERRQRLGLTTKQ